MTVHQRPPEGAFPAASPTQSRSKQWNWLRVARIAWITVALLLLAYFVAGIPVASQSLQTPCTLPSFTQCSKGQLTAGNVQALAHLHLSLAAYVMFLVALNVAVSLLFWVVGVLIFWRKSQEWSGLFFSHWLRSAIGSPHSVGLPPRLRGCFPDEQAVGRGKFPGSLSLVPASIVYFINSNRAFHSSGQVRE